MHSNWHDDDWCKFLPALHRALAEPTIKAELPKTHRELNFEQCCAWWESLRYLLHVLIGWQDLPTGLAEWYLNGKLDYEDPRLKLVRSHWNQDDALDLFAAREWESCGFTGIENHKSRIPKDFEPKEGWWREFNDKLDSEFPNPYYGGSNPLHLGHSDIVGLNQSSGPRWSVFDIKTRKALMVTESFDTWRSDLQGFGQQLPKLQGHSWHVEVYDQAIGFLGIFRQSRTTGLWFQGKHSIHMLGNPK